MKNLRTSVLPSDELIKGFTQQELAELWTVKALSTDSEINPFFSSDSLNPRGKRGTVENHDNLNSDSPNGVYFLGGTFIGGDPVVRTIIGQGKYTTYFTPFVNQFADNTTEDVAGFGGYALTTAHRNDLIEDGVNFRDVFGVFETLLDLAKFIGDTIDSQFVKIDCNDLTPGIIENYRQDTDGTLRYEQLSRHTGAATGSPDTILSDPDLGEPKPGVENPEFPQDYIFPTLSEINPSGKDFVVPFVQSGYYFGFELGSGAYLVEFGGFNGFFEGEQNITYNVLNPIEGTKKRNFLIGTSGNDYIDGGRGRDRLLGKAGDDLILGGKGADIINGGAGNDELWGDRGRDKFIYTSGEDTIFDFENHEVVKIRGFEEFDDDFEDLIVDITLPSGVNAAQIDFGSGNLLNIVGVSASALEIDDGEISLDDFD
ncbi:MAG: calcium-binding protein [Xenococcus sp. (in: cyanobacteria)]